MADGVVPTPAFNEQLKRVVRESIRRDRSTGNRQGRWQKRGGTGTSHGKIRFEILSASFSVGLGVLGCDYVNVEVTHVSCGYTGVTVGDEVIVFDPEYCHFNLPIELLTGLRGTATMMDSEFYQDELDCVYETIGNDSCIWMIDTLCCAEEEVIA